MKNDMKVIISILFIPLKEIYYWVKETGDLQELRAGLYVMVILCIERKVFSKSNHIILRTM